MCLAQASASVTVGHGSRWSRDAGETTNPGRLDGSRSAFHPAAKLVTDMWRASSTVTARSISRRSIAPWAAKADCKGETRMSSNLSKRSDEATSRCATAESSCFRRERWSLAHGNHRGLHLPKLRPKAVAQRPCWGRTAWRGLASFDGGDSDNPFQSFSSPGNGKVHPLLWWRPKLNFAAAIMSGFRTALPVGRSTDIRGCGRYSRSAHWHRKEGCVGFSAV